jgi:hypothetical protein
MHILIMKFCRMWDPWGKEEKENFAAGLEHYHGNHLYNTTDTSCSDSTYCYYNKTIRKSQNQIVHYSVSLVQLPISYYSFPSLCLKEKQTACETTLIYNLRQRTKSRVKEQIMMGLCQKHEWNLTVNNSLKHNFKITDFHIFIYSCLQFSIIAWRDIRSFNVQASIEEYHTPIPKIFLSK